MPYIPPAGNAVNFAFVVYVPPSGDAVNFEFEQVPLVRFPLGFLVWKKLGRPEWADPLGVYGIYQRRKMKNGKGYIKMKFYTPTNPQTVPQQANRTKFADAMSTWGALTPEEKAPYIERAKRRQMKPWGLFVREYYQTH